ncbi:biorientation of chromosomes in cell division protein 1-like 1 isoform X2 [Penaeus chinensis]|uniref:biorientation of chromosomes in cell division protein 1-like 1 isoform X2 n=1 Tax=Penaeus chinensis TaxID=139456 RepID=UPI001FB849EB|nr:biorientation of chromosomes in cell division protein 1-like 1 isoform X2 [Penaeus chinensis]
MPAMDIPVTQLPPGDPRLVEAIVGQLKSKGIFDQFRKECLADVDTKPAFQNLRQRVEGHVNKFLEKNTWKNDLNKNQLRDGVRKHVQNLGILESGIDAIITQVLNPKIKPLILPYVEDTVYTFLQIDKPKRERQGTNKDPQDTGQPHLGMSIIDTKPSLIPMETDVISSEEDDILARESPDSLHKSPPTPHDAVMKSVDDNAQDGFGSYSQYEKAEDQPDALTGHVERLNLDEEQDSKPMLATKPAPLPLFDDQSLDSISSNSSGLTFSPLSGKGSPSSRKSQENLSKLDESPKAMQDLRSTTSTPLVDEKPAAEDEEASKSSLESEPMKEAEDMESKPPEPCNSQASQPAAPSSETPMQTPSHSSIGAGKEDDTMLSGTSLVSLDEDSQESKASISKVSVTSEKSEAEEKAKSEKSEGEITSSSSELSDSDNKGRHGDRPRYQEKHYSDYESSHKSSKGKSEYKSKHDSHSRDKDREKDKDKDKDKESRHSKEKDRKHSKSRDDHHSHRDRDKKHHRRDKDHDGDRDRSRGHHHESSSSSHKEGSSSGSGKSSGDKDKERSSHQSSDKSSEGKNRRDTPSEKSESKSSDKVSEKSEKKSSEKSGSKSNDKPDSRSKEKLDKKSSKSESKSSSKSDSKQSSQKTDKKVEGNDKYSSKHKKDGKREDEKHKSENKEEKRKRDEKESKRDKEERDSRRELKDKKERDDKDSRKKEDRESKDTKKEKDDKDNKKEKEERETKKDKEKKSIKRDKVNTKEEDKPSTEKRKLKKDEEAQAEKKTKVTETKQEEQPPKKRTVMDEKSDKLQELQLQEESYVLVNDEGNILLCYTKEDEETPDLTPVVTPKALFDSDEDSQPESFEGFGNNNNNNKKGEVNDFEGFESCKSDCKLSEYLKMVTRIPDEMDMECHEWFEEEDLQLSVDASDLTGKVTLEEFLRCMQMLGAIIRDANGVIQEYNNTAEANTLNQASKEQPCNPEVNPGKRRRMSTCSSASSSNSSSGSPKHKRSRTDSSLAASDTTRLAEQGSVIVSGYALLTPEDDGNRTSCREYACILDKQINLPEVDYSQRINTYSPLSPASDSSADDGKVKSIDMTLEPNSGSVKSMAEVSEAKTTSPAKMYKTDSSWPSEDSNLSV